MSTYLKSQNFCKAMVYLLKIEGGYCNNKSDSGGATNFGITQKTYSLFRRKKGLQNADVVKITKEEVFQIYFEDYWVLSGADKISDFPLALVLFDSSVNLGVGTAKLMYKEAGNDVEKFLILREEKYKRIVERNPSQKIFLKGWMNRLKYLKNYIEKEK